MVSEQLFNLCQSISLRSLPLFSPGASLLDDLYKYFSFHHSRGDTMTVMDAKQMNVAAAVWAVVSYVIADMEEMLPRSQQEGERKHVCPFWPGIQEVPLQQTVSSDLIHFKAQYFFILSITICLDTLQILFLEEKMIPTPHRIDIWQGSQWGYFIIPPVKNIVSTLKVNTG